MKLMNIKTKTTISTIRMDMHRITIKIQISMIKISMIKIIISMKGRNMPITSMTNIINKIRMQTSETYNLFYNKMQMLLKYYMYLKFECIDS